MSKTTIHPVLWLHHNYLKNVISLSLVSFGYLFVLEQLMFHWLFTSSSFEIPSVWSANAWLWRIELLANIQSLVMSSLEHAESVSAFSSLTKTAVEWTFWTMCANSFSKMLKNGVLTPFLRPWHLTITACLKFPSLPSIIKSFLTIMVSSPLFGQWPSAHLRLRRALIQ